MSDEKSSIVLDAVDAKGTSRKVQLRAIPIGPRVINKSISDPNASNVDDDDEFSGFGTGQFSLISPPYPLRYMCSLKENSTELGQCINAMVVNTVGFGWVLRERPMTDEIRTKFENEIISEKNRILSKLSMVHPMMSINMILEKVKEDQYSCGNGYMEIIEDQSGNLVGLNHVRGHVVRISIKDANPTLIDTPSMLPEIDFEFANTKMWYRFRRFATVSQVSNKLIWFKEAGDPRTIDKNTGEVIDKYDPNVAATSLIHFCTYNSVSPYGVPSFIGNLFSIRGSRKAEEINFNTLSNNAIPSMFVIVENGQLTESSIDRLTKWTESQIQQGMNYSKFLILEGDTLEEGSLSPANFKIKIHPLASLQREDQLFQKYDENNREKIRQSFRLPPIFIGSTMDYNRATSDTSRAVADEQVFAPERTRDMFLINRFIMSKLGARFHTFKLNNPNITDDASLINLMGIAERSGGMTPRRSDRIVRDVFGEDIGPMPSGIPLDTPYSVTFAQAQGGQIALAENYNRTQSAQGTLEGLLELREKIEKELDSRLK